MTDHAIKINRAVTRSRIGSCPGSALTMLDAIPSSVVAQLPSSALADLLDAMWMVAAQSKAIAARDALSEGAIWDAAAQKLRPIGQLADAVQ